jgi:hypothetical protein
MWQVACPTCNKTSSFAERASVPAECPYCFEEVSPAAVAEVEQVADNGGAPRGRVAGLTLIYQINQQRIEVPAEGQTTLGREGFGSEVLGKIFFNGKPVISRRHCSIRFREDRFYLSDEGSLNGTFCGVGKADCKAAPRLIEDESLVYLGEEPFLAKIRFAPARVEAATPPPPAAEAPRAYRCKICGSEFPKQHEICPICTSFHSLEPIYA